MSSFAQKIAKPFVFALACVLMCIARDSYSADFRIITEVFPPYNYCKSGQAAGLSVDIINEALARLGDDKRIEFLPWNRAYLLALEEPNILIFTIARTQEREELFKWIAPINRRVMTLYKLAERQDVSVSSVAELKNYVIGTNSDNDAVTQDLMRFGLKKGVHFQTLHSADELNLFKLLQGRIDLVAYMPLQLRYDVEKNNLSPDLFEAAFKLPTKDDEYYFAFSRKTPDDLVERVKLVLYEMHNDGAIERMLDRYK